MRKLRWDSHIMFDNDSVDNFWKEHFKNEHKLLFILGQGFDVRMNYNLSKLIKCCPDINIECLIIQFNEGDNSSSSKYQPLVNENIVEFDSIINSKDCRLKRINIWNNSGNGKKKVGDRKVTDIIGTYKDIESYTDIIVDISSLPRGIYFSLIGKLLSLIDINKKNSHNMFIAVAENAKIDSLIIESASDDDLSYLHGFGGGIELESEMDKPLIWFPILGENKLSQIIKGSDMIATDKNRLYEICPVLPFPSKDPRRSEELLIEYHELLFATLDVEAQNIMYMTERDPFQGYIQLSKAINNYKESLGIIGGCKAAISNYSSKLMSIGSILVAYENQDSIGILNLNSGGYIINDVNEIKNLKNGSETFVTWLTGLPYQS